MHHQKTKSITLAIVGALALTASAVANAQSSDSTARGSDYGTSGYGRWDDSATDKPNSWIPMTSYGYVGASIGESHLDLGTCAPGLACDNQGTGYKIFTC